MAKDPSQLYITYIGRSGGGGQNGPVDIDRTHTATSHERYPEPTRESS